MKPHIKKLRTCRYSKEVLPSGPFQQTDRYSNKLHCDHPVMKVGWTEKVCGPCAVYENRNASVEETSSPAEPSLVEALPKVANTPSPKPAPPPVGTAPTKTVEVTPPIEPPKTAVQKRAKPALPATHKTISPASKKEVKALGSKASTPKSKPTPGSKGRSTGSSKSSGTKKK